MKNLSYYLEILINISFGFLVALSFYTFLQNTPSHDLGSLIASIVDAEYRADLAAYPINTGFWLFDAVFFVFSFALYFILLIINPNDAEGQLLRQDLRPFLRVIMMGLLVIFGFFAFSVSMIVSQHWDYDGFIFATVAIFFLFLILLSAMAGYRFARFLANRFDIGLRRVPALGALGFGLLLIILINIPESPPLEVELDRLERTLTAISNVEYRTTQAASAQDQPPTVQASLTAAVGALQSRTPESVGTAPAPPNVERVESEATRVADQIAGSQQPSLQQNISTELIVELLGITIVTILTALKNYLIPEKKDETKNKN